MKTCPFCAEEIQDAAIKCKHCGSSLVLPQLPEHRDARQQRDESPFGAMAILVYLLFGIELTFFFAEAGHGVVAMLVASAIFWSVITAVVSKKYGRPIRGFLLGLILGPIGLLIAILQK